MHAYNYVLQAIVRQDFISAITIFCFYHANFNILSSKAEDLYIIKKEAFKTSYYLNFILSKKWTL